MIIAKSSYAFVGDVNYEDMLHKVEVAGRTCYQSQDKICEGSAEKLIKRLIASGHNSVLEHASFTVKIVCDRSMSHQIVRHRISSYSQESQRYCNYSKGKFNNQVTFILPKVLENKNLKDYNDIYLTWKILVEASEEAYFDLLKRGVKPEDARKVLPECCKTTLVITKNISAWRDFFIKRTVPAAQYDTRSLVIDLLNDCKKRMPVFFEDIEVEEV